AVEHLNVAPRRALAKLFHQPRFADPRFAGEQDDARRSSDNLAEATFEDLELVPAPDEGRRTSRKIGDRFQPVFWWLGHIALSPGRARRGICSAAGQPRLWCAGSMGEVQTPVYRVSGRAGRGPQPISGLAAGLGMGTRYGATNGVVIRAR